MFMKSMRSSARYVMLILAFAFVGWLVFEGINDMRGGNLGGDINPVVGEVAGRAIRYNEWNAYLQNELAFARQNGRSLTEEDVRLVTNRAWDALVNATLLDGELDRLEITATDSEIREAFLNQPPPEMFTHPAFQTDGAFDIEKYRRFFTDPATDQNTLLQIESYYRSLLPRAKLEALVKGGIYVSEDEAWRFYRDTNETAKVRFVRVDPQATIPDSAVFITDAEVRAYYDAHRDDFQRPATARVNMVSVALRPTIDDTVAARQRAVELRDRVVAGEDFAVVAEAESGDPATRAQGGDMGKRARSALDPALAEAAYAIRVGDVSDPVETAFGFHILKVEERSTDSLSLRQIFVPIEVSGETEDIAFNLMDELEGIALRADLLTAADSVGLAVQRDVTLSDGLAFVPGAGALGVAADWALDPVTDIGEVSQFFENATGFHLFELLGRSQQGVAPVTDVAVNIRQILSVQKKKLLAREAAAGVVTAVAAGTPLDEAAARFGWTVEETGMFRRGDFVPGLGQGTEAIGEAFGAPLGATTGVVDAGDGVAVLQVLDRVDATREGFEEVKEAVLSQLEFERTQQYVDKWLASLRAEAVVEDHRARLNNPDADAS